MTQAIRLSVGCRRHFALTRRRCRRVEERVAGLGESGTRRERNCTFSISFRRPTTESLLGECK